MHHGVPSVSSLPCKLKDYKRPDDYIHHFAHYLFAAKCKGEGVEQFTKFLHLAATSDWTSCSPAHPLGYTGESLLLRPPVVWHHHLKVYMNVRCGHAFPLLFPLPSTPSKPTRK
jgi:hypothetical protein